MKFKWETGEELELAPHAMFMGLTRQNKRPSVVELSGMDLLGILQWYGEHNGEGPSKLHTYLGRIRAALR